jgi:hypothetical protein
MEYVIRHVCNISKLVPMPPQTMITIRCAHSRTSCC